MSSPAQGAWLTFRRPAVALSALLATPLEGSAMLAPPDDAVPLGAPHMGVRDVLPAFRPPAPRTEHVSAASLRLRALATLSGSLTDALSPEDAASLVEKQALSALGATSAV